MIHYADQRNYTIRCEWDAQGVKNLARADVVIIVDVLSFSTTVDVALAREAHVLPYGGATLDAPAFAAAHSAIIAGSRTGWDSPYSISPASLRTIPACTRLVVPSPNGSRLAALAAERGAQVVAGCLRNAAAVAAWASAHGQEIAVIPAGERWSDSGLRPAIEDFIGAGAILCHLSGSRSPEADAAEALFAWAQDRLANLLLACASGRELVERGYEADVLLAAQLDVSALVPLLENGNFVDGNTGGKA